MSKLTQKAMAQAVAQLLATRTLDKITIRDITDACGLTRNTFYYHFHDVYDLLRWLFEEKTMEIRSRYEADADWEGGFEEMLDFFYQNRQMILHIYESINSDLLFRFVNEVMYQHAEVIVAQQAKGMKCSEEAIRLSASFYMNATVGDVIQWLRSGMDRTPEQMAQTYDILFSGTVRSMLKSAEEAVSTEQPK